jgi:hypothetical protein
LLDFTSTLLDLTSTSPFDQVLPTLKNTTPTMPRLFGPRDDRHSQPQLWSSCLYW